MSWAAWLRSLPDALRAEWFALVRRPALRIIVLVALFFLVAQVYLATGTQYGQEKALTVDNSVPPTFLLQGLQPNKVVLATPSQSSQRWYMYALGLILGSLVAGSKHAWATLKTEVAQGPPRVSLYLAQVLAVFVALALLTPPVFVAAGVASVIATHVLNGVLARPSDAAILLGWE